jgi:acetyl-CoA acetyltransferase
MRRFISQRAVIVDGVRTPFQAAGTGFKDLWPHSLQAAALKGTLNSHIYFYL